jgi:hypothetical protein
VFQKILAVNAGVELTPSLLVGISGVKHYKIEVDNVYSLG